MSNSDWPSWEPENAVISFTPDFSALFGVLTKVHQQIESLRSEMNHNITNLTSEQARSRAKILGLEKRVKVLEARPVMSAEELAMLDEMKTWM